MIPISIEKRLTYCFDEEFRRLLALYLHCDEFDYNRSIRRHFQTAAHNGPAFQNHPPVLALSLGGSTTKLLLASTEDGLLHAHAMSVTQNPTSYIHFYDYLDRLFTELPAAGQYLREAEHPCFCLTLPVMIGEDNIPFHPIKIAHVGGLLARSPGEMTPALKLENNVRQYFVSRGLRVPALYFQSDPVIAHLGGVFQSRLPAGRRSLLLVCGTGMATADDNVQRVISRLPMMDFDEELFPRDVTEGYVFESGCAGKGLYDVMARASAIRAAEPGSVLSGRHPGQYFCSLYDSVRVALLWKEQLRPGEIQPGLAPLHRDLPEPALNELRQIAAHLMERVVGSLAASLLVTAVKLDRLEGPSVYLPLFEGSIALDPDVNPRILQKIQESCARKELFEHAGTVPPRFDLARPPQKDILFDRSIPLPIQQKMDITLIGTAVAAVANDILNRN